MAQEAKMIKWILRLALLATACQGTIYGQDQNTCAAFLQQVKATYNFKPSQLTDSERGSKSTALDRFWETVKGNPKQFLPCLQAALQAPNADKWFRFDASNLLVELDPSSASKAIQIQSYTDANLDDVDLRLWVTVLAQRGFEGFDVSQAGIRWLAYPKAKYFLPEHGGYEVKAFEGALFIFGSMDESLATPSLVKIVSQPDHPSREHALWILMDQSTPESLRALKQVDASGFSGNTRNRVRELLNSPDLLKPRPKPKNTREEFIRAFQSLLAGDSTQFLELASKVPDGERDVIAVLKPEDLPLVRKVRRMIIASGSQHSIEYYKSFTGILMALVWKPELVK
jgi:hypothetical protein